MKTMKDNLCFLAAVAWNICKEGTERSFDAKFTRKLAFLTVVIHLVSSVITA
jgi:hypothetical protein